MALVENVARKEALEAEREGTERRYRMESQRGMPAWPAHTCSHSSRVSSLLGSHTRLHRGDCWLSPPTCVSKEHPGYGPLYSGSGALLSW